MPYIEWKKVPRFRMEEINLDLEIDWAIIFSQTQESPIDQIQIQI